MGGLPKLLRLEPVYETDRSSGPWLLESLGRPGLSERSASASVELSTGRKSGCRVLEGPLSGRGLAGLIMDFGEELAGPLALELIDRGFLFEVRFSAADTDDGPLGMLRPGGHDDMTAEAVLVLESRPGAFLYCGRGRNLPKERFAAMLGRSPGLEALAEHEAEAGLAFAVPERMPYALGRGVMAHVATVKPARSGNKASFREALGDTAPRSRLFIRSLGFIEGGNSTAFLYRAGPLCTARLDLREQWSDDAAGEVFRPSFLVLTGLHGRALLIADDDTEAMERGRTVLVSACCRELRINPGPEGAVILKTWIADHDVEVEGPLLDHGITRSEINGLFGLLSQVS
jgi:hypothetical protein